MFYNDHLPPHFHAEYGEYEALYAIETLETIGGELPRRAHALVLEWTALHRAVARCSTAGLKGWDVDEEQGSASGARANS